MRWSAQWVRVGVMAGLYSVGACATPSRSVRRVVTAIATGCPSTVAGTDAAAALFCGYRPGTKAPCPAGPPPATRRSFGTLVTDIPLRDGTALLLGADLPPAVEHDVEAGLRALPLACEFPIAVVQRTWSAADSATTATVLGAVGHVVADGGGDATPRCLQSADGARTSRAWVIGTEYLTVLARRDSVHAQRTAPVTLMVTIGDEDAWWRRPVPRSLGDMTPVPCGAATHMPEQPTQ